MSSDDDDEAPALVQAPGAGPPAPSSSDPLPPVPVTIVTGFLGSGKTTLLNHILTSDHGYRIAVIENEFGEHTGIESLVAKDGLGGDSSVLEGFYELSNGCICCSVKDDLVNTLEALLERRSKFDYILVETTGVADPGALAQMFWLDTELESRLALDGVVTLVDCKNLGRQLQAGGECTRQIALADRVLLNKTDLVDSAGLAEVERLVRTVNPLAEMIGCQSSRVPMEAVLAIGCFDPARAQGLVQAAGQPEPGSSHLEQSGVSTITLAERGGVLLAKLNQWLAELLWEPAGEMEIFRMKGVVAVQGEPAKFVLQAVHETFECVAVSEAWGADEARESKVVVIGRSLDEPKLRAEFRQCIPDSHSHGEANPGHGHCCDGHHGDNHGHSHGHSHG